MDQPVSSTPTAERVQPRGDDAILHAEPVHLEPTHRGVLVLAERVVQRVAERALKDGPSTVHHPSVTVQALDEDGVELRANIGIDYPDRPLSDVLVELRRYVTARVSGVLGRPVRRLDLTVDELVVRPFRRAR